MDSSYFQKHKWDLLVIFACLFIGWYLTTNFSILSVSGSSMEPTFQDNDVIVLKKEKDKEKGQIVIFYPPVSWSDEPTNDKYVKRLVAGPGDKVTIYDGDLYVNDKIVAEEAAYYCEENKELVLPERRYFLVGDNYGKSKDSLMRLCEGFYDYEIKESSIIVNGNESFRMGD